MNSGVSYLQLNYTGTSQTLPSDFAPFTLTPVIPYSGGFSFSIWGGNNLTDSANLAVMDSMVLTGGVSPVPGPIVGAGLPGLMLGALSVLGWWRRKAS
jgi:hypothetical protein